jgi:hypothetical protein
MAGTTQGFSCPQCGAWTTVLETRGLVRKRECANLHRFFTQETYLGLSNTLLPPKKPKPKRILDEARIWRVLEKNGGNKSSAAEEMGVPESTFRGWVCKLKEKRDEDKRM